MTSTRYKWIVLGALTLIFALPPIIAWQAYFHGSTNRHGQTNHGQLVLPPYHVSALGLQNYRHQPDMPIDKRWTLLYVADVCDTACLAVLDRLTRVRMVLGKDMYRTQAWLATEKPVHQPLHQQIDGIEQNDIVLKLSGDSVAVRQVRQSDKTVLVVDPNGNVMMAYGADVLAEDIYQDLKHLLQLSQIG